MFPTQIYTGDPRPRIPPHVMASSAMGLKLGVFGFLPITHTKGNAKPMHPRSFSAMRRLQVFYLHSQTAVGAGDIHTWWTAVSLITEKSEDPQFEPSARIKMVQVLGSSVYICGFRWSLELTQFPRTVKSHGQYHEPRSTTDSGIHGSVSSGVQ